MVASISGREAAGAESTVCVRNMSPPIALVNLVVVLQR
jgi:hypothetical protein